MAAALSLPVQASIPSSWRPPVEPRGQWAGFLDTDGNLQGLPEYGAAHCSAERPVVVTLPQDGRNLTIGCTLKGPLAVEEPPPALAFPDNFLNRPFWYPVTYDPHPPRPLAFSRDGEAAAKRGLDISACDLRRPVHIALPQGEGRGEARVACSSRE